MLGTSSAIFVPKAVNELSGITSQETIVFVSMSSSFNVNVTVQKTTGHDIID